MADLIIQPKNDDHLKLNNDAGTTILELANDESKLRLAQNNISASDGTTAITTSGANVTLAGTANNIGTVTSGTFNGTIGSSTFKFAKLYDSITPNDNFFKSGSANLTVTDTDDLISSTDASGNFTFNETGLYLISYKASFVDAGTEERQCRVYGFIDTVYNDELSSVHQMINSADSGNETVQVSLAVPHQVSSTSAVYYFSGSSKANANVDFVSMYLHFLKLSD